MNDTMVEGLFRLGGVRTKREGRRKEKGNEGYSDVVKIRTRNAMNAILKQATHIWLDLLLTTYIGATRASRVSYILGRSPQSRPT